MYSKILGGIRMKKSELIKISEKVINITMDEYERAVNKTWNDNSGTEMRKNDPDLFEKYYQDYINN